jgi:hypothetical protein
VLNGVCSIVLKLSRETVEKAPHVHFKFIFSLVLSPANPHRML